MTLLSTRRTGLIPGPQGTRGFPGRAGQITGGASPTGPAGGSLAGNYPNPGLAATGVTPGAYGDSSHYARFTVGADGRITAAAQNALPSTGGWQTAVDLDFTAQTTQSLATDGNYTIGGVTWTKQNSATDATPMAVTNGTGLVIKPTGSTDIQGPTYTAPLLWAPLSSLLPAAADWTTGLRLWLSLGAACNFSANFDSVVYGISTASDLVQYHVKYGYTPTSTGLGIVWSWTYNGVNEQGGSYLAAARDAMTALAFGTNFTLCQQFDKVACREMTDFYGAGLAAGAAFPNLNTMLAGQSYFYNSASDVVTLSKLGATFANLGVFVGALRGASSTNLNVTVQRLRLDYRL